MSSTPPADPTAGMPAGPIGDTRTWYWVAILSIITLGIYFLWWTFKTYDEMKRHSGLGLGGGLGLVIGIFVGIVNAFIIPSEVRGLYQRSARTAPLGPIWGLWWFLPIVGFFIWTWKTQEALNDYWTSQAR